ncbi:hypothetical protein AB0H76_11280 [Nocardia sp. NPDC050712]|uniref:hypothetical protein n=1 Tax=Nocardia sp. NPDC050712 TaxID=3155518 RepID=UPI00340C82DF
MSHNAEDLRRLLNEAARLPFGDARDTALEGVLRHAEAGAHTELAFETRMDLVSSYSGGMQPAKLFVPFARCLADYDREPGAHPHWAARMLRWYFKHAVNAMTSFPEVPKDRALAALDQMERRYRTEGQSLHAVYAYRHRLARHLGDAAAAEEWYERWCTTPRDENSDCAGCDPSDKVSYLIERGRDHEAVELAGPVLLGELTCREQPQHILTMLLLPYLRTGQLDQARDAHRRAYRILRGKPQDVADMSVHLQFCALSGNQARGLELLDRHLAWLDRAPNPLAAMKFAASAALLLRTVSEAGHDNAVVRRPAFGDRPAAEPTAAALRAELTDLALSIAARFDERNGTDHQTATVRALVERKPIVDRLPLSAVAEHRLDTPVPPVPLEFPELTTDEILERAEQAQVRREYSTAAALLRHLDDEPADPVQAGRAATVRAHAAMQDEDPERAEALLRAAIEFFGAAGDQDRQQASSGLLGGVRCRDGDAVAGVTLLRESHARLSRAADAESRVRAALRLTSGLLAADHRGQLTADPDEISRLLDEAAAGAAEAGDPRLHGDIAIQRSHAHDERGQHAEAIQAAQDALAAYRAADIPALIAASACRLAALQYDAHQIEDALSAVTEVFPALTADSSVDLRIRAHGLRGDLLNHLDRAPEAVNDLVIALALAKTANQPDVAGLQWSLAISYRKTGQLLDAADLAEEVIASLEQQDRGASARRCRYLLADVLRGLHEDDQALSVYDAIIEFDRAAGDHAEEGYALALTADLLDLLDRDGLAAERYRLAADAATLAEDYLRAAYCRYSAALSLHWSGATAAAVVALDAADQAIEALTAADPDPELLTWHSARRDFNAARVLRAAHRPADAVTRAGKAAADFRSLGEIDQAARAGLEHGQLLIELDRRPEAVTALTAALAELPDDHRAREVLTAALAEAGA